IVAAGPTQQIYVRDTCVQNSTTVSSCTPSTQLISTLNGTTPANAPSENPSVNTSCTTSSAIPCAPGQYVAFASFASNLGANVETGVENICPGNTGKGVGGVVETIPALFTPSPFLSSQPGGMNPPAPNGSSVAPAMSGDGHSVTFISS